MRKFVASFVLGIAIVCFSTTARAQDWVYTTVDFEQFADQIGENSAWGGRTGTSSINGFQNGFGDVSTVSGSYGPMTQTQYVVDGVSFSHRNGEYSWGGAGLSTRTTVFSGDNDYTNEMASITGSGYLGSSVYGVAYSSNSLSLLGGGEFTSIAIANTAYVWGSMTYGDWLATSLADGGGPFNLIINGFNASGGSVGSITQSLGTLETGALNDWIMVDLSTLAGATELQFSWAQLGELSYPDMGWNDYPNYIAFDNITYRTWDPNATSSVPEPATLAILGLGLAGLAVARRRRR